MLRNAYDGDNIHIDSVHKLKDAAHGVSPNPRKFRALWTGALSGIGNNRTENPGKASRRNGTGNRLKGRRPAQFCSPPGVPALLRIGRMTDTSPPNGNCRAQKCSHALTFIESMIYQIRVYVGKRLFSGEIFFLRFSVNTFNYYDMTLNVQMGCSDAWRL